MRDIILLLTALSVTGIAVACSCAPESSAPACQLFSRRDVIFLGTVTMAEPDPMMLSLKSARVYRFRIDKAYKGIDQRLREVLINPDNFTSCRTQYSVGAQYLVFAEKMHVGTSGKVFLSGGCSGSRLASLAKYDTAFLDGVLQGRSSTRIYGKTLQWTDGFGRPLEDEEAAAPGAIVSLQSQKGTRTEIAGPDGSYSFNDIEPGNYYLSARLSRFVPDPPSRVVPIASGGCVEEFLQLRPRTELSGNVATHKGTTAANTRIELLRKSKAGSWYSTYQFWTETDASGRFKFENLPTGEYLLGYEIWGNQPSLDSAIPTTYYPGVLEKTKATLIRITPDQTIRSLRFRLATPDVPRHISVRVTWPDGTLPGDHLLQIFANDHLLKNVGGVPLGASSVANYGSSNPRKLGSVPFTGYRERGYSISARYWVDDLGGPVPHDEQRVAKSNVVILPPGSSPGVVRLILGKPELVDK